MKSGVWQLKKEPEEPRQNLLKLESHSNLNIFGLIF